MGAVRMACGQAVSASSSGRRGSMAPAGSCKAKRVIRGAGAGRRGGVLRRCSERTVEAVADAPKVQAPAVDAEAGPMNNLYNDIFTSSGNEALGYMEEDSAGQSNIFAYEPTKPYTSDEGGSLGTASGGIFALVTVAATLAVGYAGGVLYKAGIMSSTKTVLQPLSYYTTVIEAELPPPVVEAAPVVVEDEAIMLQAPSLEVAEVAIAETSAGDVSVAEEIAVVSE